jgi:hypothetical protein
VPDERPAPDPHRESPSLAELARRVIRLRHDTDRLVAETREAIDKARATADRCRRTGPATRPDPP